MRTSWIEQPRASHGTFDTVNGGFGSAPKFPRPSLCFFLLRSWLKSGDPRTLHMVEQTLQSMRNGAIYDQLGFGFHRYATDAAWRIPHFEKMLYDQALAPWHTRRHGRRQARTSIEGQRMKYSPMFSGTSPCPKGGSPALRMLTARDPRGSFTSGPLPR